jgi:hypothetical protein
VEQLRGVQPDDMAPPPRLLPLRVTASAADTSAPNSAEALTLLLLAQRPPCDLATLLPVEALCTAVGASLEADPPVLGALVLTCARDGAFGAQLLASDGLSGCVEDAWLAVALYLRYAALGARLFASGDCASLSLAEAHTRFPQLVAAAEVRAEGSAAGAALRRAFARSDESLDS